MIDMFKNSVILFLRGRLFRNKTDVCCKLLIGVAVGVVVMVVLVKLGVASWLSVVIGCAVSGALQPRLFKNLKYA